MTWDAAEAEWLAFLRAVRAGRHELHCSESGAWFRGVSDRRYDLIPTLFRKPRVGDPDFAEERARCERQIEAFRGKYRKLRAEKSRLISIRKKDDPVDHAELEIRAKMRSLRAEKDSARLRLAQLSLVPSGERDAYVEWCFRSGKKDEPSWLILAEMQHSGLPTRLLDWSESLLVSLFFATSKYRDACQEHCRKTGERIEDLDGKPERLSRPLSEKYCAPAIWVTNPYRVSERATDRTRIWDLSRDQFDYYSAFITKREWPFERAIPAFSPWSSGRIAAQQGLFMVWGHDRRPLNLQFGSKFVQRIDLNPTAALYCVRFLREVGGFDHFSLYRDLDSLAKRLKQKFYEE